MGEEKRTAELLQLLTTERSFSETKQTQETEQNLKLSLGGIYEGPPKEKTSERSLSVAEEQNDKNLPGNFVSPSRFCSLPPNIHENIGDSQSLYDQIRMRHGYPDRQMSLRDCQGSNLCSPGCDLPRNSLPSHELPYEAAKREALSAGQANAVIRTKPIYPQVNRKLEFVPYSIGSTSTTQINGFPKPLIMLPSAPIELKNNVNPFHGCYRPENAPPKLVPYWNGSTSSTPINGFPQSLMKSPITSAELKNSVNQFNDGIKKPRLVTEHNVELILRSLPSVTTTGDGPFGRRIDGFLYKYISSGEVNIVCVCHGRFMTPAQFVEHAGGKIDGGDPMQKITVLGVALPLC